uniref:Uncharacterized protein n=1 Tax=Romanomermis culicivorax TaxID=13658 RepID=A0A915HQ28_ROMCU
MHETLETLRLDKSKEKMWVKSLSSRFCVRLTYLSTCCNCGSLDKLASDDEPFSSSSSPTAPVVAFSCRQLTPIVSSMTSAGNGV